MKTLEEAAFNFTAGKSVKEVWSKMDFIRGAIFGAKWQAKRMYTYDDIRFIAYNAFCLGQMDNPTENKFNGWIEQFKK